MGQRMAVSITTMAWDGPLYGGTERFSVYESDYHRRSVLVGLVLNVDVLDLWDLRDDFNNESIVLTMCSTV